MRPQSCDKQLQQGTFLISHWTLIAGIDTTLTAGDISRIRKWWGLQKGDHVGRIYNYGEAITDQNTHSHPDGGHNVTTSTNQKSRCTVYCLRSIVTILFRLHLEICGIVTTLILLPCLSNTCVYLIGCDVYKMNFILISSKWFTSKRAHAISHGLYMYFANFLWLKLN